MSMHEMSTKKTNVKDSIFERLKVKQIYIQVSWGWRNVQLFLTGADWLAHLKRQ
jgi:hypothetical protein